MDTEKSTLGGATVSVIIPTFNRGHILARAIDSVIRQTRPADEIIIVDDGSTDRTKTTISENYPELIYLRQSNKGISYSRNRGIKKAHGDWLAFLDSDDEWLPEKLERQIGALSAQPSLKICHTNEIWIRRGRRLNPMNKHIKSGGDIFEDCLPLCVISPSTVMIHHSVFKVFGLFDESLPVCEDYDLWLRLCAFQPVLYLDQELIVKYGGHDDQLSRQYWGMDRFRIKSLEKIIADPLLPEEKRHSAIKMLLKKFRIYLNGAKKRGKDEEVADMTSRIKTYETLYDQLFDASN